jgi:hypothetical protein
MDSIPTNGYHLPSLDPSLNRGWNAECFRVAEVEEVEDGEAEERDVRER